MELKKISFKIKGLAPLLINNPAGSMMVQANASMDKKKYDPNEEAKKALYTDNKGNFLIPTIQFRSALLTAMKGKKVKGIRMSAVNFMSATVLIDDRDEYTILIDPKKELPLKDYQVDIRRVMVHGSGVMRARPRFNEWGCIVNFLIDVEQNSPELVLENLNVAGQICGVGDFRVGKRGMFGKFEAELV